MVDATKLPSGFTQISLEVWEYVFDRHVTLDVGVAEYNARGPLRIRGVVEPKEEETMQQQRFASLTGRARELLPAEELEPDPEAEPRQSVRHARFESAPPARAPLARLGDVLAQKPRKSAAR
jgi:hypothetical protein